MARRKLVVLFLAIGVTIQANAQQRISEDRDLKEIDVSAWNCVNQLEGSAKTGDGEERNRGKSRPAVELAGATIPDLDTAGFQKLIQPFDTAAKGKRRKDLAPPEAAQVASLEKQIVSLTAYLVLAYAGPPESTNCGSVDFHDWHLEMFERPLDHSPAICDPTPIICEITPRTQNAIFYDGVRIQNLAGFFRRPDLISEPTGHKAQRVRITGYLLWDDEHNGAADVGTTVARFAANGYHQPWRSTAWEIHPILKIEAADGAMPAAPIAPAAAPHVAAPPVGSATPAQVGVTIIEPVTVKLRYGETVLQRGTKLPFVSQTAQTVTLKYADETVTVPMQATDLH